MQQTHIEQQPIGSGKRIQLNPVVETMLIIPCRWASERPFTKSKRHPSISKLLRSQFDHFCISLYIKSREWPIFGAAWIISPLERFPRPWKFGSSQTNASSPYTKLNWVPNWTHSEDVPVLNSLCYSRTEMNSRNWALDFFLLEHLHDTFGEWHLLFSISHSRSLPTLAIPYPVLPAAICKWFKLCKSWSSTHHANPLNINITS